MSWRYLPVQFFILLSYITAPVSAVFGTLAILAVSRGFQDLPKLKKLTEFYTSLARHPSSQQPSAADNFSPFKIRAIKQKRLIKFSTAINKFMSLITLFSSYNKSRAKSSLGFDARVLLCELNAIRYIQIYIEHLLVKCWSIWLDTNEYPYLHDTYMIDRSGNLPSEPERTRRTTKFSFFSH